MTAPVVLADPPAAPHPFRTIRLAASATIALGLMLLVAVFIGVNFSKGFGGLPSFAGPPAAEMTLSAQELFEDYCRSREGADARYRGRVLELRGFVANKGVDNEGPYIIYSVYRPGPAFERPEDTWRRIAAAAASGVQGVRCRFKQEVNTGEEVRIRGRCVGMPLDVELHDCAVIEK